MCARRTGASARSLLHQECEDCIGILAKRTIAETLGQLFPDSQGRQGLHACIPHRKILIRVRIFQGLHHILPAELCNHFLVALFIGSLFRIKENHAHAAARNFLPQNRQNSSEHLRQQPLKGIVEDALGIEHQEHPQKAAQRIIPLRTQQSRHAVGPKQHPLCPAPTAHGNFKRRSRIFMPN